ncbi:secreted PhoX family phosphatase [Variovorax boronicumulans]|uniref:PhoX family protein n=1 Tax=Variovorax boronicumulans TaxID=436515 RepID=UPI002786B5AD|nr:alkaline phosphatase PhoX [Variovorax boronicumulans]MDQ0036375.1 secreted PhoX family phosphatase [Variovorax boronicumulans]
MTANTRSDESGIDLDDIGTNPTANPSFTDLIASRLSRRHLFGLGVGTAGTALLQACGGGGGGGTSFPILPPAPAPAPPAPPAPTPAPPAQQAPLKLNFNAVAKSLDDVVTVPAGYTASVLYRLGDPIAAGVPAYANDGTDAPSTYDRRAGDHHDGMTFFGINASNKWDPAGASRGLLVMNHEAITPLFLHPAGQTVVGGVRTVADEVLREFYLHGVSVIEVNKVGNTWTYKQDSSLNRRVHTLTEMAFSGPAAKTDYLKTKYSTDGSKTRGTLNNCANGTTPWGTYLTCEENWAGYFRRIAANDDKNRNTKEKASFSRYGVASTGRELWATVTPDTADDLYGRWNTEVIGATATDDYRNGHNTYGWVVEIDPFTPSSMPKKRTALGRFGHEGACLGPVVVGKPLVWYMGDDSRNEYIYKFVSTKNWDAADIGGGIASGDKYMDDGRLYVARFNEDGTGVWLELKLGVNNITSSYDKYAFADAADVVTNARLAADAAGATKMDRPEWTAVNPKTGDVYVTLTNTNAASRPITKTSASNPRYYDDKTTGGKSQLGNPNGHIVRFADDNGDPTALGFKWDVYLFAARSTASADVNLSQLTADNDMSSPDGMWFSHAAPGLLWLQTDDGAYTDVTNCMLLAALPGKVGDGGAKVITNVDAGTPRTQNTFVGKAPGTEGLRRFLVGPKDCELTGIAESGDGRALFVNIQHPGEGTSDIKAPISHWPDGGTSRPRSATVVITKNDGGLIGL